MKGINNQGIENIQKVINDPPRALTMFLSLPKNQFLLQPSQREEKSESSKDKI